MRSTAVLVVALTAGMAGAQSSARLASAQPGRADARADSVRALRSARGAQAEFERVRFSALPWTDESWGGECDEIIGRFCLTYGPEDDDSVPPPEAPRVREAR